MKMKEETKITVQGWAFLIGYLAFIAMLSYLSGLDRERMHARIQTAREAAK